MKLCAGFGYDILNVIVSCVENAVVVDLVLIQGVRVTQQYAFVEHLHIREGYMHNFSVLLDFFF